MTKFTQITGKEQANADAEAIKKESKRSIAEIEEQLQLLDENNTGTDLGVSESNSSEQ
jgi:hypothetical protein